MLHVVRSVCLSGAAGAREPVCRLWWWARQPHGSLAAAAPCRAVTSRLKPRRARCTRCPRLTPFHPPARPARPPWPAGKCAKFGHLKVAGAARPCRPEGHHLGIRAGSRYVVIAIVPVSAAHPGRGRPRLARPRPFLPPASADRTAAGLREARAGLNSRPAPPPPPLLLHRAGSPNFGGQLTRGWPDWPGTAA